MDWAGTEKGYDQSDDCEKETDGRDSCLWLALEPLPWSLVPELLVHAGRESCAEKEI